MLDLILHNMTILVNADLVRLHQAIDSEIVQRQSWAIFKNGSQRSEPMTQSDAFELLDELSYDNPDHDYGIQPVAWNDGTPINLD